MHAALRAFLAALALAAGAGPALAAFTHEASSPGSRAVAAGTFAPRAGAAGPTITGTVGVGLRLRAEPGTWERQPSGFAYEWLRCPADDGPCTALGAGGTGDHHVPGGASVGSRLRVRVTATNAAGSAVATSPPTTVVPPSAPVNLRPPSIAPGNMSAGAVVTAHDGEWSGTGAVHVTRRWQRCNVAFSCRDTGQEGPSYRLGAEDVTLRLRLRVVARDEAGEARAVSTITPPVTPAAAAPALAGGALVGGTLTYDSGGWTTALAPATSYARTWLRCPTSESTPSRCTVLPGASGTTHVVTTGDVGSFLRVREVATVGGLRGEALTPPVGPVGDPLPTTTGTVRLSGTFAIGGTVRVEDDVWINGPTSFAFRWQRCDATYACQLTGDVTRERVVTAADECLKVQARATATNAYGSRYAYSWAHWIGRADGQPCTGDERVPSTP